MNKNRPLLTLHASEDQLLDLAYQLHSAQEASRLLEHVRACSVCEPRLQKMVTDRERGRVRWQTLKQELVLGRNASRIDWRGKTVRALGAIAALVAVASLALLMRTPAETELLWLSDPGSMLVLRSHDQGTSDQLTAGIQAYSSQDLEEAVRLLSVAQPNGGRDLVRRLYLGSALALQGNPRKAIAVLEEVELSNLPSPWRCELRWTLAIAYKDAGEGEKARSVLSLVAKESSPLGLRAQNLLDTW